MCERTFATRGISRTTKRPPNSSGRPCATSRRNGKVRQGPGQAPRHSSQPNSVSDSSSMTDQPKRLSHKISDTLETDRLLGESRISNVNNSFRSDAGDSPRSVRGRQKHYTSVFNFLRSVVTRSVDWLYGFDFFISYSRRDGTAYAEALHASLSRGLQSKRGFRCFLDSSPEGLTVSHRLTRETERAVRRSTALIVIVTPAHFSPNTYPRKSSRSASGSAQSTRLTSIGRWIAPEATPHFARCCLTTKLRGTC